MLRSDCHVCQGKDFIRTEIEGEPLRIVTKTRTFLWRKKQMPVLVVNWLGRHQVQWGDEVMIVDGSQTADGGPHLGCSVLIDRPPEVPYTEEEKTAGREYIRRVANHVYFGTPL